MTKDEIQISRATLDSIQLYDVTEDELEIIERGSPTSQYLNFSIALVSVFSSFLITLLTVDITDDRKFAFFLFVTIITGLLGIILFLIWRKTNKSSKNMFAKIRSRKNTAAVRSEVDMASAESESPDNEEVEVS